MTSTTNCLLISPPTDDVSIIMRMAQCMSSGEESQINSNTNQSVAPHYVGNKYKTTPSSEWRFKPLQRSLVTAPHKLSIICHTPTTPQRNYLLPIELGQYFPTAVWKPISSNCAVVPGDQLRHSKHSPKYVEAAIRQRCHRALSYHRHVCFNRILLEGGGSRRHQTLLAAISADRKSHYTVVVIAIVVASRLQALSRRPTVKPTTHVVLVLVRVTFVNALTGPTAAERHRNQTPKRSMARGNLKGEMNENCGLI